MSKSLIKIAGAVVVAALVTGTAYGFGSLALQPVPLKKNAFNVDMSALDKPATPATPAASTAAAAAPVIGPIAPLLVKADAAAGEKYAKVCTTCHSFNKGEPAKMGPNLYGIIGLKHAHMVGYNYSEAMKAQSDKDWTYEELNHFLYSPRDYIHGTKMPYTGIKNDNDRANVIAWLRTVSDKPEDLPK